MPLIRVGPRLELEIDVKPSYLLKPFGDRHRHQKPARIELPAIKRIWKELRELFVIHDQADIHIAKIRTLKRRSNDVALSAESRIDLLTSQLKSEDRRSTDVICLHPLERIVRAFGSGPHLRRRTEPHNCPPMFSAHSCRAICASSG
jgi:hypothetical protein